MQDILSPILRFPDLADLRPDFRLAHFRVSQFLAQQTEPLILQGQPGGEPIEPAEDRTPSKVALGHSIPLARESRFDSPKTLFFFPDFAFDPFERVIALPQKRNRSGTGSPGQ